MTELLFFTGEWCMACKEMYPIIDELKKLNTCKVTTIDVGENADKANKYGVKMLPSIVVLKEGEMLSKASGVLDLETIKSLIQ